MNISIGMDLLKSSILGGYWICLILFLSTFLLLFGNSSLREALKFKEKFDMYLNTCVGCH